MILKSTDLFLLESLEYEIQLEMKFLEVLNNAELLEYKFEWLLVITLLLLEQLQKQ
jgi:hypothetical protein